MGRGELGVDIKNGPQPALGAQLTLRVWAPAFAGVILTLRVKITFD